MIENRYSQKPSHLQQQQMNPYEDDMLSANNQMMMTMGSGDEREHPSYEESKI